MKEQGVDFWWIDWQQGGWAGGATGYAQNPTIMLSQVRATDNIRNGVNQRGIVLARWGGLGNHRYQNGFSGDVAQVTWGNLAYQPYFSMSGTNVGFGFWSHDLVGLWNEHELHTRWIQWGAVSAIFRTHDRGMAWGSCAYDVPSQCARIEMWSVPQKYFAPMRAAVQFREMLIPYIYNSNREAFDTGLSILRPMYYQFPELEMAYAADMNGNFPQYFFGGDMFISPIVSLSDPNTSMTVQPIWIPPGTWFEYTSGTLLDGGPSGYVQNKAWDLTEIPIFIRAGSVIPFRPLEAGVTLGRAMQPYTTLGFMIFPGSEEDAGFVYEDDGITLDYLTGSYAYTNLQYQTDGSSMTIQIATTGSYPGLPSQRSYIIQLANGLPLSSCSVNGQAVPYSYSPATGTWRYEGATTTTIITTASLSTASPVKVVLTFIAPLSLAELSGLKGALMHSILSKQNLDPTQSCPGWATVTGGALDIAASFGTQLSFFAGQEAAAFTGALASYPGLFAAAVEEIQGIKGTIPFNQWVQSI